MWNEVPLDQLGYVSRGKSRHRPRNDSILYDGDYPFIQTAEVKAAILRITEHSQTYNEVGLAQSRLWPENTLCITIAANIADTALLSYPACFPDSIIGFIADEDKCDVRFIKYYFDVIQERMRMVSQGATQDNLSQDKLLRFNILCPPVEVQKQIAEILSAYDDLIETNRRRIILLEESARLLYREWFVNFRFLGHKSVKWKGSLPEGWSRQSLYDVADLTMGYPFQSSHFNSEGLGKAAIRIRDIPDVKASTWTTEDPGSEEYEVLRGDFLIGMDGFFHMNHWASDPAWLVQRVCRVRPKNSIYRGLLALSLHDPIKHFEATISGATVAHLGAKHLKTIEIVMPSLRHVDLLEQLNNLIDQKIALITANVVATQARGELLPKLMSGAILV